jgi:hypothetical protein
MTNKIKIGEREYSTPFKYDEDSQFITDADGLPFCEPLDANERASHGAFIVSALNNREGWNKVSESLPKYPFEVLVTFQRPTGDRYVATAVFNKVWKYRGKSLHEDSNKVVAWKSLPNAYEG